MGLIDDWWVRISGELCLRRVMNSGWNWITFVSDRVVVDCLL